MRFKEGSMDRVRWAVALFVVAIFARAAPLRAAESHQAGSAVWDSVARVLQTATPPIAKITIARTAIATRARLLTVARQAMTNMPNARAISVVRIAVNATPIAIMKQPTTAMTVLFRKSRRCSPVDELSPNATANPSAICAII